MSGKQEKAARIARMIIAGGRWKSHYTSNPTVYRRIQKAITAEMSRSANEAKAKKAIYSIGGP